MNVEFGLLDRKEIPVSGNSPGLTVDKTLTIECTSDEKQYFNVKMSSTPAVWNSDAIQTSNEDVGAIVNWDDGSVLTNGDVKRVEVNGSSEFKLSFTPVRPNDVSGEDIETGAFNASAVLMVSQE